MERNTDTYCSNCGVAFNCKQNDIANCMCNTLVITNSTLEFVKSKFNSCLCKACLTKFNQPVNALKTILIFTILSLSGFNSDAQFAGPVGSSNTTAIYKDSSAFKTWANNCMVIRGWQDISNTTLGYTDTGLDEYGTGKAGDNPVVSLGDGGYAILTFANLIKNGPGPDFAVFENSFNDYFLELAFVEVSSDGVNYFRFPSVSNTSYSTQIGPFDESGDASKINNLAGKYRFYYGTPFDLEELKNENGLDVNAISHVKIIDVIGSIVSPYASYDSNHHPINDPFPTAFNNGGFDLDAVGVINIAPTNVSENELSFKISVYPNPCNTHIIVLNYFNASSSNLSITDLTGKELMNLTSNSNKTDIDMRQLNEGMYILSIQTSERIVHKKIEIKR